MGLYDTFVVPDNRCPLCGHLATAMFQTKEFEQSMDNIQVGEDVRDKVESWFMDSSSFFSKIVKQQYKVSRPRAEMLARKYPHKYKFETTDGSSWALYKFYGLRSRGFNHIRYAVFEMHDVCACCNEYYEVEGYIEDYIFKGIKRK